jgi:hypothetical protein
MKEEKEIKFTYAPSMNIYAAPGSNVIFYNPRAGYRHDQETLAKHGLVVGGVYTVKETVVHSSSTELYLVEFPGVCFNSVNFCDAGT